MRFLGFALLVSAVRCCAADNRTEDWMHYVRIAGHGLHAGNAAAIVEESQKSNVFGIEVDNDIPGRYESFLDPAAKLVAIRSAAERAHAAGNKSFVYIAGWECITAHADRSRHSLYKDHSDWVQRQVNGTPALFGGGVAFWVAPGDEDVWVSPFPPEWRARYMSLVRQIAGTGIDGVYVDVPYWMTHFTGWEKSWASFDTHTTAAFKQRTGIDAKTIRAGDVSDVRFRRWIDFRIDAVTDFMKEVDSNVKAGNPNCKTIAEIFPGIEKEAPVVGADVYDLYPVVDAIAHEYQGPGDKMGASKSAFDWFDEMIGMFAFRAFAGNKPTWMLNYSWDGEKNVSEPEAMKTLFAAQLTAGANTWDAQGHVMSGSNDLATRTQIFAWIREHERVFYDPREPLSPIGVYFSPKTRDYFSDLFNQSFKGFMNLLLMSHREFQIVTPRTLAEFRGPLLILPDARCLNDQEISRLRSLSADGTALYATGESGSRQSDGAERSENPLKRLASSGDRHRVRWAKEDRGVQFEQVLQQDFAQAASEGRITSRTMQLISDFESEVLGRSSKADPVSVKAPPFVVSQIARVHGALHVFLDNFKGIQAQRIVTPAAEDSVEISFPASACRHIRGLPYLAEPLDIPFQRSGDKLIARVPEFQRATVVWCE